MEAIMRSKNLLTIGLTLFGLLLLSLVLSSVAWMQDGPGGARPTATPDGSAAGVNQSSPSAPEALPDLTITDIRAYPTQPYVGQTVEVVVTIKNVGTQDVADGNNFHLDLYINPPTDDLKGQQGDFYADIQGAQMKVGQSRTFAFTLEDVFTDTASYNLWAQVDTPHLPDYPLGFVQESDEDNNIFGPDYLLVGTLYHWVEKDHVDFFRNMASTLDVVPVEGTVGIITNTPGLEISGDSALVLGIFDEPPTGTWGIAPTLSVTDMLDYNMIQPDLQLNEVVTNDQRYPFVHADLDLGLVVAAWEDGRNGPTYAKDVFLRWSGDGGETWPEENIMQVNEVVNAQNDQKHPAVAVAPDGHVVVAWQDHRGTSFDLYVQVFTYTETAGVWELRPCDKEGDCSTLCDLKTQECNRQVDTGANDQDQILPDISVDARNNFFVVWQDRRNYNDDIFMVRSYTTTGASCPTTSADGAALPEPGSPADPGPVRLCWGDDTRVHDDPSLAKQSAPSVSAVDGLKITGIEYTYDVIDLGPPPLIDLIVTEVLSMPTTFVVVAWEDWREGDADVYLAYSEDVGETFVIDKRVNDDKGPDSKNGIDQRAPAAAINQWLKVISLVAPTPYGDAQGEAEVPVTTMHVVWQDNRHSTNPPELDNDPDIYYLAYTIEPDEQFPWPLLMTEETAQEQVNDNDRRAWQTGPVWQGEPDVEATGSGLVVEESEGYNAYVVWADGRNYGGELENYDIYFRLFSNVGEPSQFVGGNDVMVNSGARMHQFCADFADLSENDPRYEQCRQLFVDYGRDMPPHAHQRNPAVAATLVAEWPTIFGGYLYVVWDDDRIAEPFVDRNVYLARSNLLFGGHYREFVGPDPDTPGWKPLPLPPQKPRYGSGAYVSRVYDSGSDETDWYTVDWHAVTDSGTYLTLQTRMSDTVEGVLASQWVPNRFPYPNDEVSIGAPLQGYDAPGQHIEDAQGNICPEDCPRARYIQYRVNFWSRDNLDVAGVELRTPFLFDAILHYQRPPILYLPIVTKTSLQQEVP
jgi:hypothetical protein